MARVMAHKPEPRWRWLLGIAGEIGVVALFVVFVVLLASVQP